MEIETRWCREGDEAGISALFERVFGNNKAPGEWKWRFLGNSAKVRGFKLARLAEAEGRIVGQYSLMPVRFSILGRQIEAGISIDLMVDSDFRGKGLFIRLFLLFVSEVMKKGVNYDKAFIYKELK